MNLYWSVYKNLEKEVLVLANQIHFDDIQLKVYSVKIAELLIRCSVEIESIAKDLFLANGGTMPTGRDLYFDTDCMELLENKWLISKKQVLVSAQNFYFTNTSNRIITPLNKSNKRGTSGSDWKKAYQAVKHNRTFSLSKGNIKNLIRAMGALYLLNIYFKADKFDLKKDLSGVNFDDRLGSELFSLKIHINTSISVSSAYTKKPDFDECVYLLKATDETSQIAREALQRIQEKQKTLNTNHLLETIKGAVKEAAFTAENAQSKIEEIVKDENTKIGPKYFKQAFRTESESFRNLMYEAIINKNQA